MNISTETQTQIKQLAAFLDAHEPLRWTQPLIDDLGNFLNLNDPDNASCRKNPWYDTVMQVFTTWVNSCIDETIFINRLSEMKTEELAQTLAFPIELSCGDFWGGHGSGGGSLSIPEIIHSASTKKKPWYENALSVYQKSIELVFGAGTLPNDIKCRFAWLEHLKRCYEDTL